MKEPSKCEVINDINGELINLYRVIKHHLYPFIDCFKWELSSRSEFLLKKKQDPSTLTDIQRAVRFYYLQKLAFGGRATGQQYGTSTQGALRLNLLRIEEDMSQAHLRLSRVNIEHLTWQKTIEKYDRKHTLFYLDPPYWQTSGYGTKELELTDYEQMVKLAKLIKGNMIISLNDHPDIRAIFKGLEIIRTSVKYSIGRGNRVKNQAS